MPEIDAGDRRRKSPLRTSLKVGRFASSPSTDLALRVGGRGRDFDAVDRSSARFDREAFADWFTLHDAGRGGFAEAGALDSTEGFWTPLTAICRRGACFAGRQERI